MASSQNEERRPFQFGLRSVLLVVTVYAVLWGLAVSAGPRAVGLLVAGSAVAVAIMIHVGTFRSVCRTACPLRWRMATAIVLGLGIPAAFWIGAAFQYQVSPSVKFCGFPFPAAILVLEYGSWVDYVSGLPVVLLNVLVLTAIVLVPILGARLLFARTRRSDSIPKSGC